MSRGRVLLIDDEPEVRQSLGLLLRRAGYEVIDAEDGEAAIQTIRSGDNPLMVDAIICDLLMPRMNGMEAVKYFRSQFPSIPVIVLTGHPETDRAGWFYELGVTDYLLKPFPPNALLQIVANAVENHDLFKDQFVA